jgi:hypothetical protein
MITFRGYTLEVHMGLQNVGEVQGYCNFARVIASCLWLALVPSRAFASEREEANDDHIDLGHDDIILIHIQPTLTSEPRTYNSA